MTRKSGSTTTVAVIGLSLLFAITAPADTAFACAPEVKFDQVTGNPLPDPELEAALDKINAALAIADAAK